LKSRKAHGVRIPTEENGPESALTHLSKNDAYGTTDSYPDSSHPKSARTIDNIAVRAGLDLQ